MYNFVRFILCLLVSCITIYIIYKESRKRRYVVIGVFCGFLLYVILGFIPFENITRVFSSPIEVYEYRNPGAQARLVVEGNESDYVIGDEGESSVIMVVPKTDNGWKMGTGAELKTILKYINETVVVYLRQYKDTNDYYMTIYDLKGKEIEIQDSCGSEFLSLEDTISSEDSFITYYAYISEYNEDYWISVNGEKLNLTGN